MIVVSDTSTITNLNQVGELNLLHLLYGEVTVPPAVIEELDAVDGQRAEIERLSWITTTQPTNQDLVEHLATHLDFGESQAIALAVELNAEYLIIDERNGRSAAMNYGVPIVGLVGILIAAKEANYIPMVKPVIDRVVANGFHLNTEFVSRVLKKLGE